MTDTARKIDRVLVEVTIAAPADTVWNAVRDPDQIRRWFGWDADILADEIVYIFVDHAKADDAARTLVFEGVDDRFEVVTRDGQTVLRVIRSVAADAGWDDVYEDMTEGWVSFVEQLRLYLNGHAGAERRTLYFSGAAEAGGATPSRALGLDGLRSLADGAAYGPLTVAGEALLGAVHHRTSFQLGLTVPAWGDGLLIATDRPPGERVPHGGGSVILTTFGLDDATFAEMEARWSAWWAARYAAAAPDGCQ
jgi:hypothetical protein